MKKILILVISAITILLQGCYTIVWSPDVEFPTEYYPNEYYEGYYGDYYDTPWWIIHTSFVTEIQDVIYEIRNDDTQSIRNGNGGRGYEDGRPDFQETPSVSINTGGNNTSSGSENSGRTNNTYSNTNSNSGSSSNNNSIRNESGTRNSSSGRR